MNGLLAFVLAVLLYPGVVVAFAAAWALSWLRSSSRAVAAREAAPGPLGEVLAVRGALDRDAAAPEGMASWLITLAAGVALLFPLVALILLPVPGNPLVSALGLKGDLALESGLLLGVPFARLLVGWAVPSPYTRLAADRGARLLAGAVVAMALAVTTIAEQFTTLAVPVAQSSALNTIALITRLLALGAFVFTLPVLARTTPLREGRGDLDLVAGELTEVSARDLAGFRVAEALQLVAVAAVFVAVFVLGLFPTVGGAGRIVIWLVGIVLTVVGIGAWEGYSGRAPASQERPPLNWWLGWPVLVAMLALVAAAWAARG
jgi:formate hydrogenlyase subunit 4